MQVTLTEDEFTDFSWAYRDSQAVKTREELETCLLVQYFSITKLKEDSEL